MHVLVLTNISGQSQNYFGRSFGDGSELFMNYCMFFSGTLKYKLALLVLLIQERKES